MGTTTVIVMRHAKAAVESTNGTDFGRALTARGRDDASRMGRWLQAQCPEIGIALASPALRTRETLLAVMSAWRGENAPPEVRWEPEMYLAELPTLLGLVAQEAARPLLLVGHNPGFEELVLHLIGRQALAIDPHKPMPTAAAYVIGLSSAHGLRTPGAGVLLAHMRPRLLPAD